MISVEFILAVFLVLGYGGQFSVLGFCCLWWLVLVLLVIGFWVFSSGFSVISFRLWVLILDSRCFLFSVVGFDSCFSVLSYQSWLLFLDSPFLLLLFVVYQCSTFTLYPLLQRTLIQHYTSFTFYTIIHYTIFIFI